VRFGGSGFRPGMPMSAIDIANARSANEAVKRAFPGMDCQKYPLSLTTNIENIANRTSVWKLNMYRVC